jgi:threonine/homoserine efflux transporter RhtA
MSASDTASDADAIDSTTSTPTGFRYVLVFAVAVIGLHLLALFGSFDVPFDRLGLALGLAAAFGAILMLADLRQARDAGVVAALVATGGLLFLVIGASAAEATGFLGFDVPDRELALYETVVLVVVGFLVDVGD